MRRIVPHRRINFALVVVMLYLAAFGAERVIAIAWPSLGVEWYSMRLLLVCAIAVAYGLYCVAAHHPFARRSYRQWLAQTPWRLGKTLPFGDVHLNWEDAIVLATFVGLTFLDVSRPRAREVIAFTVATLFLVAYLSSLWLSIKNDSAIFFLGAFLAPLVVYPFFNPIAALLMFVVIYLVLLVGMRRVLGRFPWDEPDWKVEPTSRFLTDALAKGVIGWPYAALNPHARYRQTSQRLTLVLSTLFAWWAHALVATSIHLTLLDNSRAWEYIAQGFAGVAQGESVNPTWVMFFWILGAGRFAIYWWGCWPPISLLGRVATGRLIIPGYDKILVAPIGIVLFGYYGPLALIKLGLPAPLLPAACVWIVLMIALGSGPRLESWRMTGFHRLVTLPVIQKPLPQQSTTKRHASSMDIHLFD